MGTVHTVAVHFRYDRYMRRLVNEFLGQKPIKWRFLTSLSGISVRFHVLYELNWHKVKSYVLKYGHTKCSRNVIFNYFENYIADRL